jgi:hypothetical protein
MATGIHLSGFRIIQPQHYSGKNASGPSEDAAPLGRAGGELAVDTLRRCRFNHGGTKSTAGRAPAHARAEHNQGERPA